MNNEDLSANASPLHAIFLLIQISVINVEHADWLVYFASSSQNKLSACSTFTIFAHN